MGRGTKKVENHCSRASTGLLKCIDVSFINYMLF